MSKSEQVLILDPSTELKFKGKKNRRNNTMRDALSQH